jgi:predicted homoserine dehydrogenase-like protein
MNLFTRLQAHHQAGKSIPIAIIGAGKFATMFLAQLRKLPAIHLACLVDLNPETAKQNLQLAGWPEDSFAAPTIDSALKGKTICVSEDWQAAIQHPDIQIIIEVTGNPLAAVEHISAAFAAKKHVINVTVEADAFCGAGLAAAAQEAGVIYSMAYGDQPALAADLTDWARACGFQVMAAGRGHKWMPHYRFSTPDTVWDHWGLSAEQAERGKLNPKMFNAFLDGSKPAIESAAIANACMLKAPANGLAFPPGAIEDIPQLMRPKAVGGVLEDTEMVEVISCLTAEGQPIPNDIRKGVWVAIEADSAYIKNCFEEYSVTTDDTGRYMAAHKKWHMIGLELAISVASIALRSEPTGYARVFNADVVAIAKSSLRAGTLLDGEGGATIYGGLRPAHVSISNGYLPLGLASNVKLKTDMRPDQIVTFADVDIDQTTKAFAMRGATQDRLNAPPLVWTES